MLKESNQSISFKRSLFGFLLLCLFVSFNSVSAGEFNAKKRYLYIQPGQSIFSIVKVLYPKQQDKWASIIRKVVKTNPHAFVGADPIKIKAGERIVLPARSARFQSTTSIVSKVIKKIEAVGQVIKSRGTTFVISKKNKKRNLDIGSEIFVGDRIFTGVRGFIRLNMVDDAKIDLRCNSEMLIEDYRLLRGGNRSVIYLIKGSVKKITGSIGKMADDIYEMHTPLATVGVRGTEYAIRVLQQHGCDGSLDVNSKGLFVKVKRGSIDVETNTEEVEIKQGEAAHLKDGESDLESMEIKEGVFEEVRIEEKKVSHLGAFMWLILLLPLVNRMRKIKKYE